MNRAELRELAEVHFARLGTLVDERSPMLDQRIAASAAKLEAKLEAKLDQRIDSVRLEIAGLRVEVATQMRDQMKWMFLFWAGTIVPLAGLMVALGKGWL